MMGTHMQPDFEHQSVEERGQSVRLRNEQGQPLARNSGLSGAFSMVK